MGNWHISIQGTGIHHNENPKDANLMAADFVAALKAAGHSIEFATFTSGGRYGLSEEEQKAWRPKT